MARPETNKNVWRPPYCWNAYKKMTSQEPRIEVFCDTETGGVNAFRYDALYEQELSLMLGSRIEDDIFLDDTVAEPTAEERELAAAIAGDDLLQFSAIKYRVENGVRTVIDEVNLYIKNRKPIDPGASKVHHITEESLIEMGAPDEDAAFEQIKAFLTDIDVFVAYNEPFDFDMIQALYIRHGEMFKPKCRFDVMAMGIDLISVYSNIAGRKLGQTAKYLGVSTGDEKLHDALEDIRLTVKVYEALAEQYEAMGEPADTHMYRTPRLDRNKLKTGAKWVMWTWKNANNHKMHRVYFKTSCGTLYFDIWDRTFGACSAGKDAQGKPKPPMYQITELNMEGFLKEILDAFNLKSVEEMSHFRWDEYIQAHTA